MVQCDILEDNVDIFGKGGVGMDRRPWGKGDERWFWVWLCAAPLLLILSIEFIDPGVLP